MIALCELNQDEGRPNWVGKPIRPQPYPKIIGNIGKLRMGMAAFHREEQTKLSALKICKDVALYGLNSIYFKMYKRYKIYSKRYVYVYIQ